MARIFARRTMRELAYWAIAFFILVALHAGLFILMVFTMPPVPPGEAPGPGDFMQSFFLLKMALSALTRLLTWLFEFAVIVRFMVLFYRCVVYVFVGKAPDNASLAVEQTKRVPHSN